ncbi:metal ABC transporter substrate-binding protein [Roseibium sp.]|uniref:metal ABC transporter substrate-binding protein n=1 Tax=Roseibium sp. TaxID=1936156 RepID=UPI003A968EB2
MSRIRSMIRKAAVPGMVLAVSATALLSPVLMLPAAAADKLKVVTTFTVIADMVREVAGDAADVESITKPGAEIHRYEPTPRDLIRAHDADLVVWNGMSLELWFEQFLSNIGDIPSVVLSDGVTPIPIGEGSYEGKPNPHAWMSPTSAQIYVDNIKAALVKYDPDNAATYEANAAAYKQRISDALQPLAELVKQVPEEQRWLVSCEGAFSYLARDLDLKELYLWPINADQTGTPQQVRKVIDAVRDNKIPAVFCESTVNTDPAKQVARETGANYGGELYVDSLSGPDGPVPTYLDLLTVTTKTVVHGLTGSD